MLGKEAIQITPGVHALVSLLCGRGVEIALDCLQGLPWFSASEELEREIQILFSVSP